MVGMYLQLKEEIIQLGDTNSCGLITDLLHIWNIKELPKAVYSRLHEY
jgi:hypothetical protein